MKIVVVGGGIGGLAAALALAGDGHRVTVVEREAGFTAAGAGIVLAANAVWGLELLGVSIAGHGQLLEDMEIRRKDGRLLTGGGLSAHGPSYGIARERLRDLMVDALPASVEVLFGHGVESVADDGRAAAVQGPSGELTADLVVAADGLRSRTRALIPGGPGRLRYSGTTCWRGLVDVSSGKVATEAWGGPTRVGLVPIGDGRTYYFLVAARPAGAPDLDDLAECVELFGGFAGVAGDLVRALPQPPELHHDLFELDRPVWGHGRVLLLGDAAHAMTPNQGQGAAMAIEDAIALRHAVRGGASGALERYRGLRGRRVRKVQLDSRRLGQVAHWTNPVAAVVRDAAMHATPSRALDRRLESLIRPGLELVGSG